MRTARIAGHLVAALAVWFLLGASGVDAAHAANVVCGQSVTSSVKLEQDLTCNSSALFIDANDVTIDLGGHTITSTGQPPGDPRWSGIKTRRNTSFGNLLVRNGTIVGFDFGINLGSASRVTIQNVVIRDPAVAGIMALLSSNIRIREVTIGGVNLGIHLGDGTGYDINSVTINGAAPGISVVFSREVSVNNVTIRDANLGIYVLASADVAIRNVNVEGIGSESAYAGIALDQVEHADVRNVDVKDAGSGVLLTYSNNSNVKDSFFENVYMGVQLGDISDVMVAGNYIIHAGWPNGWGAGIGATGAAGTTTNLQIVDNTVTNSNRGLSLGIITGSRIAGNTLLDSVYGGVELTTESTGNRITSNTVLGNGIDLLRDDPSFPNTWVDNVCQTYSHPDMACEPPARKCAEVSAGMVSWWPGRGARDIVGSNSGAFLEGAALVSGLVGEAFQFNGAGASLEAPDQGMPYGNAPRSVELWMKPEFNARFPFVYGEPAGDNAFYPIVMDASICIGQWGGGDWCGATNVVDGAWHHVALTYDGESTATLYLDGNVEVVWPGKSYATTPGGGHVYLGSNFVYTGDPETFAGLVDEVSVYDRALLRGEILAIYLARGAGKCTGGFTR